MIELVWPIWPVLIAALLLGGVFGALSCVPGRSSRPGLGAGAVLVAALAGLIVASAQGLVPGREGVWLDLGALFLASYLAGCAGGWLLRRMTRGYRDGRTVSAAEVRRGP